MESHLKLKSLAPLVLFVYHEPSYAHGTLLASVRSWSSTSLFLSIFFSCFFHFSPPLLLRAIHFSRWVPTLSSSVVPSRRVSRFLRSRIRGHTASHEFAWVRSVWRSSKTNFCWRSSSWPVHSSIPTTDRDSMSVYLATDSRSGDQSPFW